jgi:hypothetical protein
VPTIQPSLHPAVTCTDPFVYYESVSSCYYKISTPSNWTNARATCAAYGAYLATVEDLSENSFIASTFGTGLWIGYNDIATENMFVWDSGSASSYTNWDPAYGEPNGGTSENCGLLVASTKWYDVGCFNSFNTLCEMEAYPAPSFQPAELPNSSNNHLIVAFQIRISLQQGFTLAISMVFGMLLGLQFWKIRVNPIYCEKIVTFRFFNCLIFFVVICVTFVTKHLILKSMLYFSYFVLFIMAYSH